MYVIHTTLDCPHSCSTHPRSQHCLSPVVLGFPLSLCHHKMLYQADFGSSSQRSNLVTHSVLVSLPPKAGAGLEQSPPPCSRSFPAMPAISGVHGPGFHAGTACSVADTPCQHPHGDCVHTFCRVLQAIPVAFLLP